MDQITYTKIFLKQSNQAVTEENIKLARRRWWTNTRTKKTGGLRLSDEGLRFLREEVELQIYEVPIPDTLDIKPEVIVHLDNVMDCPYHLSAISIMVTNERKCFELLLFAGDIQKYGLIKAMRRQKGLDSKKQQSS